MSLSPKFPFYISYSKGIEMQLILEIDNFISCNLDEFPFVTFTYVSGSKF